MDKAGVFEFLRGKRLAVIATVHASGAPEAALIGYALTPAGEFVFDTERASRKAVNLATRPQAALVIGWDDETSVQVEGVADRPEGSALEAAQAAYFAVWPDGRERARSPAIVHFVITPRWIRYSRFAPTLDIVELALG